MPFVYVAGYRPEITIFRLDTASGKLIPAGRATNVGESPSFLAFDPAAKFLFAANETDPGRVRSFAINQTTGALTPINDVPAMGSITAHLSTDSTGRWLLVANYGSDGIDPGLGPVKQGTIASVPIGADGRLAPGGRHARIRSSARWRIRFDRIRATASCTCRSKVAPPSHSLSSTRRPDG